MRAIDNKWPKFIPELTIEQKVISDDFMKYWHEILPKRYAMIEKFNHGYVVQYASETFRTTLEIGAGLGEHLMYERLSSEQEQHYVAVDLRDNMAVEIKQRFPKVITWVGDCQEHIDFPDNHFDRVLAIHVLEHLPNLPAAIKELHRLCHKEQGIFSVVIPCEGGLAYTLARKMSAERIFERRYKQPYRWFIEREHINKPDEILAEIDPYFSIVHRSFFPFHVPMVDLNLCIGLTLKPRRSAV